VQAAVEKVKDTMTENVEKTLANVEKFEDLQQKAATVNAQAQKFEKQSAGVLSNFRCKYYKTTAIIVLIVVAIMLVIIVPIAVKYS